MATKEGFQASISYQQEPRPKDPIDDTGSNIIIITRRRGRRGERPPAPPPPPDPSPETRQN